MGIEIERKFLVKNDDWRTAEDGTPLQGIRFRQGYLAEGNATVRVRCEGEEGRLTIKSNTQGVSRLEFEYAIPIADAEQLLDKLCKKPLIEKTRYVRHEHGMCWEIDVFDGENDGLIVAEVELSSEEQAFRLPAWVGAEVSADGRYYNVNLVKHPYREWGVQGDESAS